MHVKSLISRIKEVSDSLGLGEVELPPEGAVPSLDLPVKDCLLLKSDNLVALDLLLRQKQSIDFCYIDPPYNTGNGFIYHDRRRSQNSSIWARHHDWLAFMMPRLVATQMLLVDEGVIAISIDDYEYPYLKILMDAVFGESNYISTLIVCRSKNGKGGRANVAINHEYVVLYGKTQKSSLRGVEDSDLEKYNKEDQHGKYKIDGLFRKKGDASKREDRPNMFYPLYYSNDGTVYTKKIKADLKVTWPIDSKGVERRWLWGVEKAEADSWKLYSSPSGIIYVKNYSSSGKRIKIRSILDSPEYLTDRASREVKSIYGDKIFETPKPITLIKDLIDCCSPPDAIVLDYFAGTGTTAHACYLLNEEKGASRKSILVEHEYNIDRSHPARLLGFTNTAELTEFRLRQLEQDRTEFSYSSIVVR